MFISNDHTNQSINITQMNESIIEVTSPGIFLMIRDDFNISISHIFTFSFQIKMIIV